MGSLQPTDVRDEKLGVVVTWEGLEVVGQADQEEVVLPCGDHKLAEVRGDSQVAKRGSRDTREELLRL